MPKFLDAEYMANMLELQDDAHFANSIHRLAEQRDALLEACTAVTELANDNYERMGYAMQPKVVADAFATIAKVKADLL